MSNWFISAGAGIQVFFGDHDKQMDFVDRITPNYEINFGKWFTPGIGVRAGLNGYKIKGLTQNGAHSTGEKYVDKNGVDKSGHGYWLTIQEQKYFHVHGDVLFNLNNLFAGYKEDRFYSINPYVGIGWMVSPEKPKSREVSASLGILNQFRLSNKFNLFFDVRGAVVKDGFDSEMGERKEEGMGTATLGITYNFKKRNWDKPVNIHDVISYSELELNKLRDKVNKLAADNDALKEQLANAKSETITEIKIEKQTLAAPILVTFPIDTWKVSNEARVNLGFFANVIKQADPNIVYKITGYADKGTGTKARNTVLGRERAKVIYDVLVNEFKVPASQLITENKGGVENMYYDDPRLSRAVIVIGN